MTRRRRPAPHTAAVQPHGDPAVDYELVDADQAVVDDGMWELTGETGPSGQPTYRYLGAVEAFVPDPALWQPVT